MGTITKSKVGKTIEANTINLSDIREIKKTDAKDGKAHRMVNVEIPMFDGQVFEGESGEEKYGHNKGQLTIDLATVGPYQTEKNKSNPDYMKYTGSTASKTPVDVEEFEDLRDTLNPTKAKIIIDPVALANAEYDIKKEHALATGIRAPHESTQNRLNISAGWSTTHDGVGAMSAKGMTANVAQIAAQNYVFSASAKNPDAGMPTKADIEKTAELINNIYAKVAKDVVAGKYSSGVKSKGDPTQIIDKTDLKPSEFKNLKVCTVNGATVIAAKEPMDKADTKNALDKFSKIVNVTISQTVNDPASKAPEMVKKLANMVKINSYPVSPYEDGKKAADLTVVQPSVNVTFQPFANVIQRSTDLMRRVPDVEGNVRTAADVFGEQVVENAQAIHNYAPKSGLTREQALEAQSNFVAEIRKALDGPDGPNKPGRKSKVDELRAENNKNKDDGPNGPDNDGPEK